MAGKKAIQIQIEGHVQGVFFRASAREKAEKLDLKGYARNEPDGSITMEVEGEGAAIKEFVKWCEAGSKYAEVSKVNSKEIPVQHFTEFSVL